MREDADWESLVNPASKRQRANRVSDVRRHVIIPPLANERERSGSEKLPRALWLDLLGDGLMAMAICLAILVVLIKCAPEG